MHVNPRTAAHNTRVRVAGHQLPIPGRLLQRGLPPNTPGWLRFVETAAIVAGAALMVTTAAIHLHLWLAGYRHVPRIGPLFLAQAVTGFVAAPLVVWSRQTLVVLGAAGFMAASAVGLLLSATVGFLGIHDDLSVPWATPSLAVELAGFLLMGGAGLFQLVRRG
jgi:hypothetical protein